MAELILLPSPAIDRGAGPSKPFIEPAPLVHVLFDQLRAHPIPGHRARRARRRGAGVPHHRVPRLPREPRVSSRMSGLRQARTGPKTEAYTVRFAQHASSN